ncbi:MAG: hypothetical protein KKF22_09850 [Gammaproteobacteria bacterium]|nr:hypothetical protein [Gammaproteobacteria bacterium]
MSMEVNKAKESLKKLINFSLTHWVALIAILYSFSVGINIIYTNSLFSYFSINPWEFYEGHDILISAFMRADIVAATIIISIIAFSVISFLIYTDRVKDNKNLPAISGMVVVTAVMFPIVLAPMSAEDTFFNLAYMKNDLLEVQLKDNTKIGNVKLVASPGKFHIYYKQDTQKVEIIAESEIIKVLKEDKLTISNREYENIFKLRIGGASRDLDRQNLLINERYYPKLSKPSSSNKPMQPTANAPVD